MFRYCAMALEADSDEFGYTDASDIEIESEILEIGEDYEAPEPEFRRKLQSEFRDFPPKTVPMTHPSVLAADTLPPMPKELEGLMGLPAGSLKGHAEPTRSAAPTSLPERSPRGAKRAEGRAFSAVPAKLAGNPKAPAATVQAQPANEGKSPVPGVGNRVKEAARKARAEAKIEPPSRASAPPEALPKKTPAKEQIAPLAGARKTAASPMQKAASQKTGKSGHAAVPSATVAKSGKARGKTSEASTPAKTPVSGPAAPRKPAPPARTVSTKATTKPAPRAEKPRRSAASEGQIPAKPKGTSKSTTASKAAGLKAASTATAKRASLPAPTGKKSASSPKAAGKAANATSKKR